MLGFEHICPKMAWLIDTLFKPGHSESQDTLQASTPGLAPIDSGFAAIEYGIFGTAGLAAIESRIVGTARRYRAAFGSGW